MDEEMAKTHRNIVWDIINEAFRYSNEKTYSIPPDLSLADFVKSQILERSLNEESSKLVLQIARM